MLADAEMAVFRVSLFGDNITAVRTKTEDEEKDKDLLKDCPKQARWLFACLIYYGKEYSFEELQTKVWPDVSTGTGNVRRYLSELRRALFNMGNGEHGDKIETRRLARDGHDILIWKKSFRSSIQVTVDPQCTYIDVHDFLETPTTNSNTNHRLLQLYDRSVLQGCQGAFAKELRKQLDHRRSELLNSNTVSGANVQDADVSRAREGGTRTPLEPLLVHDENNPQELRNVVTHNGNAADEPDDLITDVRQHIEPKELGPISSGTVSIGLMRPPLLHLGRADVIQDLKRRLGIFNASASDIDAQTIVALYGMPGIGKSTTSVALAMDQEVRRHFTHVLWSSIGQTTSLLPQMNEWIEGLGGNRVKDHEPLTQAVSSITRLLADKRALLIVDDLWEASHFEVFRVIGGKCAMLVTTRQNELALGIDASRVRLLGLSEDDAFALFKRLAPIAAQYEHQCREIAHNLDGLPLGISVAARLLRLEHARGQNTAGTLRELMDASLLLEQPAPTDYIDIDNLTNPKVDALLRKSTDRLPDEVKTCFILLGSFAATSTRIPKGLLFEIWGDVADKGAIIKTLWDYGLIDVLDDDRIGIHALVREHAKTLTGENHD